MNATIVVGYDKTPNSDRALAEAAREAAARCTSLTIVHAFQWLPPITPIALPTDSAEKACREAAQQIVDDAAATVLARRPDLPVIRLVVEGGIVPALAVAGADLLVVGNRGHGGFLGLLLGSVPVRVLAQTRCPVMVVRGESRPRQDRVLAAVDIDRPSDEQLEFAFATASHRGARLTVLHVWGEPWFQAAGGPELAENVAAIEADRAARLEAVVGPWQAKYPDVSTTQQVRTGSAGALVVAASTTADLVVVGGRRVAADRHGVLIGPVAVAVLHHAACPVSVVPFV